MRNDAEAPMHGRPCSAMRSVYEAQALVVGRTRLIARTAYYESV